MWTKLSAKLKLENMNTRQKTRATNSEIKPQTVNKIGKLTHSWEPIKTWDLLRFNANTSSETNSRTEITEQGLTDSDRRNWAERRTSKEVEQGEMKRMKLVEEDSRSWVTPVQRIVCLFIVGQSLTAGCLHLLVFLLCWFPTVTSLHKTATWTKQEKPNAALTSAFYFKAVFRGFYLNFKNWFLKRCLLIHSLCSLLLNL